MPISNPALDGYDYPTIISQLVAAVNTLVATPAVTPPATQLYSAYMTGGI